MVSPLRFIDSAAPFERDACRLDHSYKQLQLHQGAHR